MQNNTDNKSNPGKWKKRGPLFLLILTILGFSAYLVWDSIKASLITDKLEHLLDEKTDGLYVFSCDSLLIDEINGNLYATNINVNYVEEVYEQMEEKPSTLFNIKIPRLSIDGVKTPEALITNEIEGHILNIFNPHIQIINTGEGKFKNRYTPHKEVYEQILGKLNKIKLDTTIISNAMLSVSHLKDTQQTTIELSNVRILLEDILVNKKGQEDSARFLFSKEVNIYCDSLKKTMKGNWYYLYADSLVISSSQKNAFIKSVSIKPRYNEKKFVAKQPFQNDRFDITVKDIRFKGINTDALFEEQILIDTILADDLNLKVYRDLHYPRDKKLRIGSYPHQLLSNSKLPMNIHFVQLRNSYVEYKERNVQTGLSGKVRFHHTLASINHISNIRDSTAVYPYLDVYIDTRFLNEVPLNTQWRFFLFDTSGKFTIKAHLKTFDAQQLNVLTKPMGPVEINSGTIHSLDIDLTGNNYSIDGTIKMLYNNLKINVLKQKGENNDFKKKGFVSFLANTIIKNANPRNHKSDPVIAEIQVERDTNRSIFNLIWKAIFTGVKSSVGL